jgi:hypothetical protein
VKALDARWPTRAAEIEEDVAEYRGLTPEENDAVVCGLARSAMEILRGRPISRKPWPSGNLLRRITTQSWRG